MKKWIVSVIQKKYKKGSLIKEIKEEIGVEEVNLKYGKIEQRS